MATSPVSWLSVAESGGARPPKAESFPAMARIYVCSHRILHSADRGETWVETGVRIGSVVAMAVA